MGMNLYAVRAIYRFEMARTFRTLVQSIAAPVLTTSLYFIVFGAAIGRRMANIDGVTYAAFIVPGLIMLSILTESVSNGSFGIYMPKWSGTIYEMLSAPVSAFEVLLGYVGSAASKSIMLGLIILATARLFVPYGIAHPLWAAAFLVLTSVTFSLFGFILGVWAEVALFNPVVYLVSGFRWSFYGVSDVGVGLSLGMTLAFMLICLAVIWWIFRTGWRLKT
jgi:ABC-2 type transport system permease protein